MFVYKLLSEVCILCAKPDIAKFIAGQSSENYPLMLEEQGILLQAFHTIERELAIEYLPILQTEEIDSTGFIPLESFKREPLAIQNVENMQGIRLPFTVTTDGVVVAKGRIKITYSIYPKEKNLTDKIEILERYRRVLLLGVAAEYAMLSGQFELFNLLEKKYKDAISYACRTKGGILKMRRWL